LGFISHVSAPNVGVNFDPANLTIYGTDDPVRAVSQLRGLIDIVHLKDAFSSARPGADFGRSAPFGTGQVQIARVVSKLRATGYGGPLLLEVKGADPVSEIRAAIDYLRSMLV
jgi:sugar phosphate isomerase/epimerase